MLEFICFLLPLAAFSGWYIGKQSARDPHTDKKNQLTSDYTAGVNFLLNEQTDKAVDTFINMLDASAEGVETTLALGNFFRRRGEVSRAIRIHQNLASKPNLTPKARCQSLLDLAQDYLCAGVYDRAETLLLEVIDDFNYQPEAALSYLIDIYEREKDWEKAIAVALRLQTVTPRSRGAEIAHYYCELAELAWAKGKIKSALKCLKQGEAHDPHCARINMLRGCFEIRLGKYKRALDSLKQVYDKAPHYLPEVLPLMMLSFDKLGQKIEGEAHLIELSQKTKPPYLCKQCGFSSRLLNWQCPSCRQWAVLKPHQTLEENKERVNEV